ncbi:thiamine pyrophosphate-dependent enzyme [Paeniglutamicibacter terrestris]|uniref:Acetolactate synthase n=1 Tax=Paeniglutamicibacter terrestris TaxID=2723403 RepID=A0ABX1FZS9_9MICC|nr:thiamine pyrophosphate-dependent enzyme [Paeniglutamicibacter terrestris]ASN38329.1 acetolactate synthase [Arthrobacter sp. 7749]NKG19443.1 acetolactate synthase [Paeniglutamicibacter terrestris]
MTMSAGHLIVKTLEAHGISRVYAVPGESYLDVLDGLHDSSIHTVVTRHEGGAGFMALAEGRLGQTPGIAMVTRGPGAANAMIAIHTAWQDATAMVLFVGLIPLADRGRDSFQEFSLGGWFSTTAKGVFVLDDEHQAGDLVARALRLASTGRPGPVVVGLPEDVLVRLTESPLPALLPLPTSAPSAASLDALATALASAQRPVIIAGGDDWETHTSVALADFAAAAHVPVLADWRAYDVINHESPAYAGWLGYGRAERTVQALNDADLLIFIGCTRSDVLSEGYKAALNTPTIVVSTDAELIGHAGRIDAHLSVSPAELVTALPQGGTVRGTRGPAWMDTQRAQQLAFSRPGPDGGTGVDLGIAFEALEAALDPDRILTYGAGNATLWGHRYLSHHGPKSLVGPRNGAMGLAVPAAVAASIMYPGRHVVAICGDGDFFMNAQELAVSFAHGGTPLVIVADNGIFGTIVAHQQNHYPQRPSGTAMENPNFAQWIQSFGGHGEFVETTADFAPALERALASGKPAVLHLKTDPSTMGPGTVAHHELATR